MKILRLPSVIERVGLSKATINRLEEAGKFPRRLKLSKNAVGWCETDVDQWMTQKRRGSNEK